MTPPTPRRSHWRVSDLQAAGRLATQATLGLTDLVENLHHNILRRPGPLGPVTQQPAPGLTGFVYRSIRGITRLVGGSVDALLAPLPALLGSADAPASPEREKVVAALNGVLGDHLQASGNPLAIPMALWHAGHALDLAQALPQARPRVMLQIHGLCMSPGQWSRRGRDAGAELAARCGYTALHLHYNTGMPIEANGRQLAALLQTLHRQWPMPLEDLVIVAHSMGGLVARSACQQAMLRGDGWPARLSRIVFLGTPHRGAPLERGGHAIDRLLAASPYSAAFARLGRLRSAGITDLRHGEPRTAEGQPAPLPAGVACFAVAGSLGRARGSLKEGLLGDGLVPLDSAFGRPGLDFAPAHRCLARGVGHLELMDDGRVWQQLERWLAS